MTENNPTAQLLELINSNWSKRSIDVHNRISDIRVLIGILGAPFDRLDSIAVEIESLAGTALGFGDQILCEQEEVKLGEQVSKLRNEFEKASLSKQLSKNS